MGWSFLVSEASAQWVAQLTRKPAGDCKKALEQAEDEASLSSMIKDAHKAHGREFYAQIRAHGELYALTRLTKPKHIVEIGVSSGVSSSYFLSALKANGMGTLHSIDMPTQQKGKAFSEKDDSPVAVPPGKRSGWAVPTELKKGWDLRVGKSRDLLPRLVAELDSIDIFLHDSEHTFENAMFELSTVDPKVPSGGVILCDNNKWLDGAFDSFATGKGARALYWNGTDLAGLRKP